MIVNRPKRRKKPSRYNTFIIIMAIIFTVISIKLLYIQVFKHDDYVDKANTTATKTISAKAPRGTIYDCNGNALARNKQTYTVTYTSTVEADKNLYTTIDEISKILKRNDDQFDDNFVLRVRNNDDVYFDYKSTTDSGKQSEELRFKRDRGLNENIQKKLFGDKTGDLTEKEISEINDALMNVSPKETFYYLVKNYNLINLIDPDPSKEKIREYKDMTGEELTKLLLEKYSFEDIRRYMVVKDKMKMQSFKGDQSVTIASDVKKETYSAIMQNLNNLPGIYVNIEPEREYPYNELASSAIGYIASIDETSKEKYELKGYDASKDLIGVSGIEAAFEDQLKGVKGGTTVKVNSKGQITQNLFQLESYPGNNVYTTIDKDIQYVAEQSLKDSIAYASTTSDGPHSYKGANRGAAVVVNVNTGEILASVSYPSYNPNDFASGKLSDDKRNYYLNPDYEAYAQQIISKFGLNKTTNDLFPLNEDGSRTDSYDLYPKRLYNYATQGLIPPGSTFKPLTALVGLEEGVISPTDTINDTYIFNTHPDVYGNLDAKCWKAGGHGRLNVKGAIEQSCNFFFYEVAYKLYEKGLDEGLSKGEAENAIAKYAWQFGLGFNPDGDEKRSTGIEIEENFGQTYNFKSIKENFIENYKFALRDYLESGKYNGTVFCPFDYSDNEDDSDELKQAKTTLKEKLKTTLNNVTDEEVNMNGIYEQLLRDIKDDVKNIMNLSEKYKNNLSTYGSTIDKQVTTVSDVIARYIVFDVIAQITTPSNQVQGAIGQNINNFSPIQLAQYVSTLANKGTRYKLHYVSKITSPDGKVIQEYKPEVLNKIDISDVTWKTIVEGMENVNDAEDGTAALAFEGFPTDVIKTAGKTGTADFRDDQYEVGRAPYATYVGFAPADKPEIAVVSVIYDGGHGGSAARVARSVYEQYFKDRILQANPNYTSEYYKKYVETISQNAPDNKAKN
ncbi:MAG: penicillin-binding transpeptidase domain-containing protein [Clostridiaceae bacterium]|nr:penicillin-binding transpeptidase domain-containing protein [Clostridiaceae bacterium]